MSSPKIAIHVIGERGLIFDINSVKRLREEYHVCGTLIGILPQIPQQNVFQGMPLELMPEEVRYLVEECDAAYLVDDAKVHDLAALSVQSQDVETIEEFRKQKKDAQMKKHADLTELKRRQAILNKGKDKVKGKVQTGISTHEAGTFYKIDTFTGETPVNLPAYDVFEEEYKKDGRQVLTDETRPKIKLPEEPAYQMYKYLQKKQYFLSPGLRFGGQFLAYPGDPLRYHSHHIAIGYGWDDEFNVLDIIGGGRLATAVKKCWYIGGQDENDEYHGFSIEWSGFG